METKYPTLTKPKRKLCYFANKKSPSKQWTDTMSLGDVDKMFDDLDSCSHDNDDILPQSPHLQTSDTETNHCEKVASPVPQEAHLQKQQFHVGPEGDVLHPATTSPSSNLDIDLEVQFKAHRPVQTSSPIGGNMVVNSEDQLDNKKVNDVSPILFACEDEGKEEAKTEPLPQQKPQCDGDDDVSGLESPPKRFVLSKSKMSTQKNKVEGSCSSSSKESQPVNEEKSKKPKTAVLEEKGKTQGQEKPDPPVLTVREEPELAAPEKQSPIVVSQPAVEAPTRVEKSFSSFLQKVRDAAQAKPACSRMSPVKEPSPPEPYEEFLILDDEPFCFSIPRKATTGKRHKQNKTSSTDKESSTDKGTKDSSLEPAQKQQEAGQANGKPESTSSEKMKKGKEKKNKETEPGPEVDGLGLLEDPPMMEQEKPNKKKQQRFKETTSEIREDGKKGHRDRSSRETDREKSTVKTPSHSKRSKSLKDGNEHAKKSRALKKDQKAALSSDAAKEMEHVESGREQSPEHPDAEDPGSFPEENINSEAQTTEDLADGNDKQKKPAGTSEESLSEDDQIRSKRKRSLPRPWWLSSGETKATDDKHRVKKSKQKHKEPSAAAATSAPVKAEKDRVLKRRSQTQPATSSSHITNKAKAKKTKLSKKMNARGDAPDHMKVFDLDLDEQSSPLVFSTRELSNNSGDQLFQRVYHHSPNEKTSVTSAPVSPRRPKEQPSAADAEKRRSRKPPGNWWELESVSPKPLQHEPKPHTKEKQKITPNRPTGTPKNGKVPVSLKAPGGAPVSPLKVTLSSARRKRGKRSLSTFNDTFCLAAETLAVVSSEVPGQTKRNKVRACPVEVSTCRSPPSYTVKAFLSVDAAEPNSPQNHSTPHDSKCHSENMLRTLRSGPSSMIDLEEHEENDDYLIVPSSRDHISPVLSVSDLCAPPLKPLILQPKDKANLAEWFKSLWSNTVNDSPDVTPDQFDWYFYQGRALGFLADLNCGSIMSGKILLGSYTKKPLWVDHSASSVFHLLTSSVMVTIDNIESRFHPGQSFMVPVGHAYSIKNMNAQPAVLFFSRVLAESLD